MSKIISINPSTEEIYGEIDETPEEEIDKIIKEAKKEKNLSTLTAEKRAEIISHLIDLLDKNKDKIALVMANEIGKPLKAGRHEIEIAKKRIEAYCKKIPEFIADELLFEDNSEKNIVRYEPMGVAVVISPWNAPVFVSLASIIPQILVGNNVLWKPSEYSSFTGLEISKLFDELKKQGLPEKSFQTIIGGKEIGKKLVESDIDFVALTGSTKAGKEIIKSSADKLHRFVLELGGKDPAIVLEDVDIEKAAKEIAKTGTMYSGQVCFGVERVYCHKDIYNNFVEKCVEEMKKLKVGDPLDENTDLGPLSVKFQFEKVKLHIKDALEKGARTIYGCETPFKKGYFITPGILTNVNHSMLIMKEETFGPILPIMKFETIEEAIKLANDSDYGLTASVWTKNLEKGQKIAEKVEAGTVEINRHGMSKAGYPWGGFKQSGIGRIYSKEAIRSLTNIKHIWTIKT